jgi:hemoglobin-like flavoprotein
LVHAVSGGLFKYVRENKKMNENQIALVQESWKKVLPIREVAAELFYGKLFELDPTLRALFRGDMVEQGRKLMTMIGTAVAGLSRLDQLVPAVELLGARHVGYGVQDHHYDTVAAALLDTLQKGLGEGFTAEVKEAWVAVYGVLAGTMKGAGAAKAA